MAGVASGASPRGGRMTGAASAPPGRETDEGRLERGGPGAGAQLGRAAGGDHAAPVHRGQPVEPVGLLHVGGGDEDAHPRQVGADGRDQLPELTARERIDPGRGLVEDQQVRVVDQRRAERKFLLHAARELAGGAVGEGVEARGAEQHLDPLRALRRLLAEEPAEELEVLAHREGGIEVPPEPLRHVGHPRRHRLPLGAAGHVVAEHGEPAALQPPHARDQREKGGLAHPVRPDQPRHPARGNGEADRIEGGHGAVAVRDARDLGYALHALSPAASRPDRRASRGRARCARSPDRGRRS